MTTAEEITSLAAQIEAANKAYYDTGTSPISDEQYDIMVDRLQVLYPSHPLLKQVGTNPQGTWPKTKHPIPMGSLTKTKRGQDLSDWMGKAGTQG